MLNIDYTQKMHGQIFWAIISGRGSTCLGGRRIKDYTFLCVVYRMPGRYSLIRKHRLARRRLYLFRHVVQLLFLLSGP